MTIPSCLKKGLISNEMKPTPTEAAEQRAIFEMCAALSGRYPQLGMLFHIPNGGSRNTAEAANLKRQGVKPGVPDLFLAVPSGKYHGMFIELKRRTGGRVSEHQRAWLNALSRQGYRAIICNGAREAVDELIAYLRLAREEQ